jgi:nucleoside 2-deoxyribosyltransferase
MVKERIEFFQPIGTKVMPSDIAELIEEHEAEMTPHPHYPNDIHAALVGRPGPEEPKSPSYTEDLFSGPEFAVEEMNIFKQDVPEAMPLLYVSGPMTGYDGHNFVAFDVAERVLEEMGYNVVSPAQDGDLDSEGEGTSTREQFMRRDIDWVLSADGVVVLDGWEMSRGSRLEVAVAREIGLPIFRLEGEELVEEDYTTTLEEALEIAGGGSRQQMYGHPIHNMHRTAQIWSGILGIDVTEEEVALCMIGVKLARESFRPQRDNLVDISGYGLVYEQILRGRETLKRGGTLPNVDRQREISG